MDNSTLAKRAEIALLGGDCEVANEVVTTILERGEQPANFGMVPPKKYMRLSYYGDYHWLYWDRAYAYVARDFMTSRPWQSSVANAEGSTTEAFRLRLDPDLLKTLQVLIANVRRGCSIWLMENEGLAQIDEDIGSEPWQVTLANQLKEGETNGCVR